MSALARRVGRLERRAGSCPLCGGCGGLAFAFGGEPAPERPCPGCGRAPLLIRVVEITKEEFDARQRDRQTHCAA